MVGYSDVPIRELYLQLSWCGRNNYNLDNEINSRKIKKLLDILGSYSNSVSDNLTFYVPYSIKLSDDDIAFIFGK